jgi:hypothetical protein
MSHDRQKSSGTRGIDRLMVYLEGPFAWLFRRSPSVPAHRLSQEAAQCRRQPILAWPAWYCGLKYTILTQIVQFKDTPSEFDNDMVDGWRHVPLWTIDKYEHLPNNFVVC